MQGRIRSTRAIATCGAMVLAMLAPSAAAACEREGAPPAALSLSAARSAVLCLVNERRKAAGVGKLRADRRLARAAQRHSKAMDARNFFSHTGPGGSSPASRIAGAGYLAGASFWGVAENIGWGRARRGSPKAAVAAWMQSPPHRAALLTGRYRHLGVGFTIGSPTGGGERNTAIYTTTFGYRG